MNEEDFQNEIELASLRQYIFDSVSEEYSDPKESVVRQGKRIVVTLESGLTMIVLVSKGRLQDPRKEKDA